MATPHAVESTCHTATTDAADYPVTGIHERLHQMLPLAHAAHDGDHAAIRDALETVVHEHYGDLARMHRDRKEAAVDHLQATIQTKNDLVAHGATPSEIAEVESAIDDAIETVQDAEAAEEAAFEDADKTADNVGKSYDRAVEMLGLDGGNRTVEFTDYDGTEPYDNALEPTHFSDDATPAAKVTSYSNDTVSEYVLYRVDGVLLGGCHAQRYYSPLCKHAIAYLLDKLEHGERAVVLAFDAE